MYELLVKMRHHIHEYMFVWRTCVEHFSLCSVVEHIEQPTHRPSPLYFFELNFLCVHVFRI